MTGVGPNRKVKTGESFTDSLRWWLLMLIECPACLGFWIGLFVGMAFPGVLPTGVTGLRFAALECALFTCGSNLLLANWAGLMEGANESADGK